MPFLDLSEKRLVRHFDVSRHLKCYSMLCAIHLCKGLDDNKEYKSPILHNVSSLTCRYVTNVLHVTTRMRVRYTLHTCNKVYICSFLSEARPELSSQIVELHTDQEASGFVLIALNLIQYLRVAVAHVPLDQLHLSEPPLHSQ